MNSERQLGKISFWEDDNEPNTEGYTGFGRKGKQRQDESEDNDEPNSNDNVNNNNYVNIF